jgi:hypothetical protein
VQQNAAYISELQVQIPIETKNAEKLHWKVIKDRSEFEMYRNDYIKKFAYKLKGRQDEYATITSNEERIYHETLHLALRAPRPLRLRLRPAPPPHPAEHQALASAHRAHSVLTATQAPFDLETQTVALLSDAH